MNIILDLIGSAVIFGTILMTVLNININMTIETGKTAMEYHTQTELVQLSRILEFDLYKVGYGITGNRKIITADSTRLKFKTNLWNGAGEVDSVEYILGTLVPSSTNPRDRVLTRYENTTGVLINYSITQFKLTYYNSRDSILATPVTGSTRDSIRAVKVFMTIESPDPIGADSTYSSGSYTKVIYPRNL